MKLRSLLWMPVVLAMSACGGTEVTEDPTKAGDPADRQVTASCVDTCGDEEFDASCQPCPQGGVGERYFIRYGCTCQFRQYNYYDCRPAC